MIKTLHLIKTVVNVIKTVVHVIKMVEFRGYLNWKLRLPRGIEQYHKRLYPVPLRRLIVVKTAVNVSKTVVVIKTFHLIKTLC